MTTTSNADSKGTQRVVIVSGVSGSGKSTAIKALEDSGYFCIDNLPIPLLPKVLELSANSPVQDFAFVVDTRELQFLADADEVITQLRVEGVNLIIAFFDADDDTLIRRYSETRRPHPMSAGGTVRDGIARERELLNTLRHHADRVIETSSHTPHTLKALVKKEFSENKESSLQITVLSFGYKHGLPLECDLVFDVRFLPNPYFVEGLREKTGLDPDVRDYVLGQNETGEFIQIFRSVADFMLPMYVREQKTYLTIGIGCTGGHHRSVAVSESLGIRLRGRALDGQAWKVEVRHRDIEK